MPACSTSPSLTLAALGALMVIVVLVRLLAGVRKAKGRRSAPDGPRTRCCGTPPANLPPSAARSIPGGPTAWPGGRWPPTRIAAASALDRAVTQKASAVRRVGGRRPHRIARPLRPRRRSRRSRAVPRTRMSRVRSPGYRPVPIPRDVRRSSNSRPHSAPSTVISTGANPRPIGRRSMRRSPLPCLRRRVSNRTRCGPSPTCAAWCRGARWKRNRTREHPRPASHAL